MKSVGPNMMPNNAPNVRSIPPGNMYFFSISAAPIEIIPKEMIKGISDVSNEN
jgi:hypothetical protein